MNKIEIAIALYAAGKISAWNNNNDQSVRVLIGKTWWPLKGHLLAQLTA